MDALPDSKIEFVSLFWHFGCLEVRLGNTNNCYIRLQYDVALMHLTVLTVTPWRNGVFFQEYPNIQNGSFNNLCVGSVIWFHILAKHQLNMDAIAVFNG